MFFYKLQKRPGALMPSARHWRASPFSNSWSFLTFVRTAHFWTKVHPELKHEDDITELLTIHKALAGCVLRDPEAKNSESTKVLLNELTELRKERDQAEMLRITLASIRGRCHRHPTPMAVLPC